MNAIFKIGKVKVGSEDGEVEKDVELITLSGGFLGKDEITRPATDMDRYAVYKEEYAAFKNPPSPPVSAGASKAADATDAGAAGADDTKPPSAG